MLLGASAPLQTAHPEHQRLGAAHPRSAAPLGPPSVEGDAADTCATCSARSLRSRKARPPLLRGTAPRALVGGAPLVGRATGTLTGKRVPAAPPALVAGAVGGSSPCLALLSAGFAGFGDLLIAILSLSPPSSQSRATGNAGLLPESPAPRALVAGLHCGLPSPTGLAPCPRAAFPCPAACARPPAVTRPAVVCLPRCMLLIATTSPRSSQGVFTRPPYIPRPGARQHPRPFQGAIHSCRSPTGSASALAPCLLLPTRFTKA